MILNKQKNLKDKSEDKSKISSNSKSKGKNSKKNNLSDGFKFIKYKLIPLWQEKTEALNSLIIREEGSEFWSAISPSQKWSSRIVWTLVSIASFGILLAPKSRSIRTRTMITSGPPSVNASKFELIIYM